MADPTNAAASLENLPLFTEPDGGNGSGDEWGDTHHSLSGPGQTDLRRSLQARLASATAQRGRGGPSGQHARRGDEDLTALERNGGVLRPMGRGGEVDWGLVRAYREQAADQLAHALRSREGLDDAGRRELGRSIVVELLADHAERALTKGLPIITPDEQIQLADAIMAALFGLGRLQPLVDDPGIENIEINGHDNVHLIYHDGRIVEGPPVADSDEELIETLSFLATRTGTNERPFSPSNPRLHLRLRDGSRLAATAWITPRPVAVIRKHRLTDIGVKELVDLDMLSPAAAAFLATAVRARKSLVVSGAQGAGKALALDTPIPTPDGWTTMGHLRAGDRVFDETGSPCEVVHAHDVQHGRPCYEVVFDTGDVITADAEHLWRVTQLSDRRRAKRATRPSYAVDHEERRRLREIADHAADQPERDVTIAELVDEVGSEHNNVLRAVAKHLGPAGRVAREWHGHHGAVARRDVMTYSRQRMLKELAERRSTPRNATTNTSDSVVLTTAELARNIWAAAGKPWRTYNHVVPLTGALEYERSTQFIDPYVLGVWLGDGATATARVSSADPDVIAELERLEYTCTKVSGSTYDYQVGGNLQAKLRAAGVLGDKHIPRPYRQGDRAQRLALLQGLMDSDGTCAKRTPTGSRGARAGACEFTSVSEVLAMQVHELVAGLGYKPTLRSRTARFRGQDCGPSYTVAWTTRDPMFRLPRKLDRQQLCGGGPTGRAIVEVRPVDSVPVRCITVDSPNSLYLVGRSCIPTHNTTLVRALTNELDPMERIGTIETEYELHLHDMPERHRRIVAWEARPGSGERGADGRAIGEITLDDLVFDSLRMNLSRLIVGEVRGREVLPMFKAMQSGAGSLSTTHAHSARAAIERLVTCAMEAGQHVTESFAYRQIAEHIDLIVQIELVDQSYAGGKRSRYISEIIAIEPGEHGLPAVTDVFQPGDDGRAVPGTPPIWLGDLERVGFNPRLLDHGGAP